MAALGLAACTKAALKEAFTSQLADFVAQFDAATGIKLVKISAGTFIMGSPPEEKGHNPDEGPQTKVTLTQDFFLGSTEVTQAQWTAVMGTNPGGFKGAQLPVESVSWDEAMEFCQNLTSREHAAGRLPTDWEFTLPTEAQWEYACRAGTTGAYTGNEAMTWYDANSGGTTHPVALKQPNAWGLYDMQGNVWERCRDWYGAYPGGEVTNPTGPPSGSSRVIRGGGWDYGAADCRSAFRSSNGVIERYSSVGFRLALAPSLQK